MNFNRLKNKTLNMDQTLKVGSFLISITALLLSLYNFRLSIRAGNLELQHPSRIGWAELWPGQTLHGKQSDVLVLSFFIRNNGNAFRGIQNVKLFLHEKNDSSGNTFEFMAQGQFSALRDITYFTEQSLEGRLSTDEQGNPVPDYHYSLISGIALDRHEYQHHSLLFQIQGEDNFKLKKRGNYVGRLVIEPFNERDGDLTEVCFGFDVSEHSAVRVLLTSSYLYEKECP